MSISTLTRLGLTLAMSGALAAMSFASHAQHEQDVPAPHDAAAQQDKQDNWRFDGRQSFAYQDGYYGRRSYGTNANGSDSLLGTVLNILLNLKPLQ